MIMKNLFNFNVIYSIALIILLFFKPTSYFVWILVLIQVLIFFIHGKENFLKR